MDWRIWIESEPVPPESWGNRVDVLLDVLEGSPAIEGPVGWGAGPVLGAVFEVAAPTAAEASDIGLEAFGAALAKAAEDLHFDLSNIRRFEVAPADFEPDALLGATDVARLLGISRQRVYQLTEQSHFPKRVAELARGAVWRRSDVEAWLTTRPHWQGRPPKDPGARSLRQLLEELHAARDQLVTEVELTDTQRQVLQWLEAGTSAKEVASKLGLTDEVLRSHMRQVYEKLAKARETASKS